MEIYVGSKEDRNYISEYLAAIRKLHPLEVFTVPSVFTAETLLDEGILDAELWNSLVSGFKSEKIGGMTDPVTFLRTDKYFFGTPYDNDPGGFFSSYSVGYQHWYQIGYSVLLNPRHGFSKSIITLEAVRNYLHDCLHHATFISYRRQIASPASSRDSAKRTLPKVYRYQHGFNFRNARGISFSAPKLTERVPSAINLNLLMDGLIIIHVAGVLRRLKPISQFFAKSHMEEEYYKEIILLPPFGENYPFNGLFKEVVQPSAEFTEHWGGRAFSDILWHAMISGELEPLKSFFDSRLGQENGWESTFRQPAFTEE